jgi:hypothetical protein
MEINYVVWVITRRKIISFWDGNKVLNQFYLQFSKTEDFREGF